MLKVIAQQVVINNKNKNKKNQKIKITRKFNEVYNQNAFIITIVIIFYYYSRVTCAYILQPVHS